MKTPILIIAALNIFSFSQGQNIPQSQVSSAILNVFTSQFPKATDVEWEIKGNLYEVEFETGRSIDHEVWYDESGKIVKHKEDISIKDLPKKVRNIIKADFRGYTIDDLERITENGKVVYKMELNSLIHQDWDIVIDSDGKILSKVAD